MNALQVWNCSSATFPFSFQIECTYSRNHRRSTAIHGCILVSHSRPGILRMPVHKTDELVGTSAIERVCQEAAQQNWRAHKAPPYSKGQQRLKTQGERHTHTHTLAIGRADRKDSVLLSHMLGWLSVQFCIGVTRSHHTQCTMLVTLPFLSCRTSSQSCTHGNHCQYMIANT